MKLSISWIIGLIIFFQYVSASFIYAQDDVVAIACEKTHSAADLSPNDQPQFPAIIYRELQKGNLKWKDSKNYLKGYIIMHYNDQNTKLGIAEAISDTSFNVGLSYTVDANGKAGDWTWEAPLSDGMTKVFQAVFEELPLFEPGKLDDASVCVKDQLKMSFTFEDGKMVDAKKEIFQIVEEMPRFPGCEQAGGDKNQIKQCASMKMLQFVYGNLKYPAEARANRVEGTGVVRFIVNKKGDVVSPMVTRSLGSGCDEAMLDVITQMPRWIPGKQRGKPVAVYFNLPIKFKLE